MSHLARWAAKPVIRAGFCPARSDRTLCDDETMIHPQIAANERGVGRGRAGNAYVPHVLGPPVGLF